LSTAITVLAFACVTISCAKTTVTARQTYAENEQLPKPDRIIVYDFAATPEEVPADDPLIGLYDKPTRPQTADEVILGRKLGAEIAGELVKEILNLGMPAERSSTGLTPGIGDLLIKGVFVSIDEGSRLKRILIGFGSGAGELKTLVEIYQITTEGPRPLVSEEIKTTGGKMPGMFFTVPAAVFAGPAGLSVAAVAAPGPAAAVAASGPAAAVGQSTATSGSTNIASELGPESIGAAAKKTAKEIINALTQIFARHGWIRVGN
jgi:hypothetical protein